jgi:hypothetical protein
MIKRIRRFGFRSGFRGGIHICMERHTWRQDVKDFKRWGMM